MTAKTTGSFIVLAAVSLGVAALVASRMLSVELTYPVTHAKRTFAEKVWSRVRGCARGAAASAENVRLRREVGALALLRGDIERLERENARLRRALGYASKTPEMWVAAAVLSRQGAAAGAHDTLRVDKGGLDGVQEGAVVTVPEGLVGRVVRVTPHTSEVLLLTDSSLKAACEVEGVGKGSAVRGILSGGSDELLVLSKLSNPAGSNLPAGARVLTSGRGGLFPRGLEVGRLTDATSGGDGSAYGVEPFVDFSALEDVFIRREK